MQLVIPTARGLRVSEVPFDLIKIPNPAIPSNFDQTQSKQTMSVKMDQAHVGFRSAFRFVEFLLASCWDAPALVTLFSR